MDFTVKLASYEDLPAADRVERETMGDHVYLSDAWHYFCSLKGGLVCVYDGDKMIGIGRFTVLPDGTGWLETLRVIPPYQHKGAGKAIYKKWLEMAKEYGCPSMAMFTGVNNLASSGLAEIYGLRTVARHRGYHLKDLSGGDAHGFHHVYWQRATELILPRKEEYNNYMTFNRTFHRVNEANVKAFAIEGKVFEEEESGSFIVCGGRFQQNAAMHIAMMGGDLDRCIDFAVNLAKAEGIKQVSCTFALENRELEKTLAARGFVPDPSDIITKEVVF